MEPTTRVPAAERRVMMIEAGIEIARTEGGGAVTLARVAQACGVTKPIAYRLFGSLPGLLEQMHDHIVAEVHSAAAVARKTAAASGADARGQLRALAQCYLDSTLDDWSMYEAVAAARIAAGAEEPELRLSEGSRQEIRDLLGARHGAELGTALMLQGAADHLAQAVRRGSLDRDEALSLLVSRFAAPEADSA